MPASDTLLKIRVYTKLALLAIVALYATLFILLNYSERIDVWLFFGTSPNLNAIVALAVAYALGALTMLLARTALTTWTQWKVARERGRTQRLEREVADMRTAAAKSK
jgi:hypothetical protein